MRTGKSALLTNGFFYCWINKNGVGHLSTLVGFRIDKKNHANSLLSALEGKSIGALIPRQALRSSIRVSASWCYFPFYTTQDQG